MEFALVVPIFVMLVFGIISFGIVFAQQLALGNASREAARASVVEDNTCGQIESTARRAASSIAMNGSSVTVRIMRGQTSASATNACAGGDAVEPCAGSSANDGIYVVLDFESRLVVPLLMWNPSFPLQAEGVFRCEFS